MSSFQSNYKKLDEEKHFVGRKLIVTNLMMLVRLVLCLMVLLLEFTENETRSITSRKDQVAETTEFSFGWSEAFEDASFIFGKVVEKIFSNKKLLGIESPTLYA